MVEISSELGDGATKRIGRFRVETVLGTGAFATVYRAIDERLDDQVAIKVLAENHSLNADLRERFITEGRVLRRVDNPHVLRVYDLGETSQSQPFLVLEYAERGTLTSRVAALRQHGWSPSLGDLWSVAEPLAEALQAIHGASAVHRDVNPSNLLLVELTEETRGTPSTLLRQDERLVVADLGLCKDLALNSGHTSAGGTEGFRPPELRRGPAIIDRRADIWSLSAVLVWLATGAPPGDDISPSALVRSGVPQELSRALSRGLAGDPEDRHPDVAAWLRDVVRAIGRWTPPATTRPVATRPPDTTDSSDRTAGSNERPVSASAPAPDVPTVDVSRAEARPKRPGPSPMTTVLHSLWMLTLVPMGLTTWAGFLYIGLRAQRARWLWYSGSYATGLAVVIVMAVFAPTDASGNLDTDSGWFDAATASLVVIWLVGIAHGVLANRSWLRIAPKR